MQYFFLNLLMAYLKFAIFQKSIAFQMSVIKRFVKVNFNKKSAFWTYILKLSLKKYVYFLRHFLHPLLKVYYFIACQENASWVGNKISLANQEQGCTQLIRRGSHVMAADLAQTCRQWKLNRYPNWWKAMIFLFGGIWSLENLAGGGIWAQRWQCH